MDDTHDYVAAPSVATTPAPDFAAQIDAVVSTHVLVPTDIVEKLRDLSKRTRIAQSEYLREAVDDLLSKYAHMLKASTP